MNKQQRFFIFFAAFFGVASLVLATLGAHVFHKQLLNNQHLETFAKAVDYAMYAALVLPGLVALKYFHPSKGLIIAGYLLIAGTLLFSGSLTLYTLLGLNSLTQVTPIGGTLLIIAWLTLGLSAFQKTS